MTRMANNKWSQEEKLLALMALPWDVRVTTEDDGSLFAQVTEVRDAVADGADERELSRELWESLYASLALRLEGNLPVPLPKGHALPWEQRESPEWHPTTAVAGPLLLHREAYLKALHSQDAAGKFAIAV